MKEGTLSDLADDIQVAIETAKQLNGEGKETRSRELSLVITELQSAQNWLARILAPGFIETVSK